MVRALVKMYIKIWSKITKMVNQQMEKHTFEKYDIEVPTHTNKIIPKIVVMFFCIKEEILNHQL